MFKNIITVLFLLSTANVFASEIATEHQNFISHPVEEMAIKLQNLFLTDSIKNEHSENAIAYDLMVLFFLNQLVLEQASDFEISYLRKFIAPKSSRAVIRKSLLLYFDSAVTIARGIN